MNDRRLGLALLAFLVVVDLVLIALALRPAPAASTAGQILTDTVDASPSPTAPAVQPVPARHVAFRTGGLAYATTPGSCDGTAAQAIDIPVTGAPTSAAAPAPVVGLVTTNPDGSLAAVAGEQNCTGAQQYAQGQDGRWVAGGEPTGTYFGFPGATAIATPNGPTPNPCAVIDLASTTDKATVLCDDGQLRTNSGGTAWDVGGTVAAGVALAPGPEATLYALSVAAGCDGLQFSTSTDGGGNWTAGGCVQGATASGPVGLAVLFDAAIVVDGTGNVYRSPDGGASFSKGG